MKRLLLLLSLILLLLTATAHADDRADIIRVGLHSLCDEQNRIAVSFDGPHVICDSARRDVLLRTVDRANSYYFSQADGVFGCADECGLLAPEGDIDFALKQTLIAVQPGTTMTINGRRQSGDFSLGITAEEKLIPVVHLERDSYLKGVLPKEMSPAAHIEALKAQAIAARTFSVRRRRRFAEAGYDICDTTSCQVYGGDAAGTAASDRAVDATHGMILTYDGKPVDAFYHASSGGYVENSEDIFSAALPYLVADVDPYSDGVAARPWQATFTLAELTERLAARGYQLGRIVRWSIDETLPSGRVTALTIVGRRDRATLNKEEIRSVLGYDKVKSLLFAMDSVDSSRMATAAAIGDCDLYSCKAIDDEGLIDGLSGVVYAMTATGKIELNTSSDDDFTLRGKGRGHGLGMSQVGAKAMAEDGYSYDEILQFYYKHTEIKNIDEVSIEDE